MTPAHLRPDGEAIGLSPDRCGARRGAELPPAERALYVWILRSFAEGGIPARQDVEEAARDRGVDVEPALRRLEELDLARRDATGAIRSAYPFSAVPTGHRVELGGGPPSIHAMCAVDALGIPFMLHREGVVQSADPVSGAAVTVTIDGTGRVVADPADPVVIVAHKTGGGPLASSCCPLINLFASRDGAERFLAGRPDLQGAVLGLDDAVAVARAVFEAVLDA